MHTTTLVVFTFDIGFTNSYLYAMVIYLTVILFILCMAVASGGIFISSHLRSAYKADFLTSLMFFQIFWFTFGFNVIWGQIILVRFLETLVAPENLSRIKSLAIFLGSPFAIFAWLMLLKQSREISERSAGNQFVVTFLSLNLLLIPGAGYLLTELTGLEVISVVKLAFIFLSLLYALVSAYYLNFPGNRQGMLTFADLRAISFALLLLTFLQDFFLFFYETSFYFTLAFILLLFAFGGFMPVFLRYKTDLSKLLINYNDNITFNRFCEKYEISKREKEVILEICEGLSNQQIADRLFISLQTVKDHTHRIYGKTDCSSRAQLIRMVRGGNRV